MTLPPLSSPSTYRAVTTVKVGWCEVEEGKRDEKAKRRGEERRGDGSEPQPANPDAQASPDSDTPMSGEMSDWALPFDGASPTVTASDTV